MSQAPLQGRAAQGSGSRAPANRPDTRYKALAALGNLHTVMHVRLSAVRVGQPFAGEKTRAVPSPAPLPLQGDLPHLEVW